MIQQGLFREDLFFRLNVVPVRLPPLRERTEDVPDLLRHFFALAERDGLPPKQVDAAALERLRHYRWPGNVRELENLSRRLAALYPQEVIGAAVIDAELAHPAVVSGGRRTGGEEDLSHAVERHLSQDIFRNFPTICRHPGSIIAFCVRSNIRCCRQRSRRPAATRSRRPTSWGSIAIRCARKSAISTFR